MNRSLRVSVIISLLFISVQSVAQITEMWDKSPPKKGGAKAQWFQDAKFGVFVHWGLADFRDFWDGEVTSTVVKGPWEAIFTHNDSWAFSKSDQNFK